jgi:uncharacterized membrane protein (UPF0127 family)
VRRRTLLAVLAVLIAGAVYAVSAGAFVGEYDRATVVVEDEADDRLATVDARVADTTYKRYVGLSATDSLGPDEGMLFVHETSGTHAYVMRDMAFPLDIVFVAANGTITTIHEAPAESRPYTRYEGQGLYVLEVRQGYTADHGIEVGDRVRIEGLDGGDGTD